LGFPPGVLARFEAIAPPRNYDMAGGFIGAVLQNPSAIGAIAPLPGLFAGASLGGIWRLEAQGGGGSNRLWKSSVTV